MSTHKVHKKHVYWKPEEVEAIITEGLRLKGKEPHLPIKLVLERAQHTLPIERRRYLSPSSGRGLYLRLTKQILEGPVEEKVISIPDQVLTIEVPVTPRTEEVIAQTPTSLLVATLFERFYAEWERFLGTKAGHSVPHLKTPRTPVYPELVPQKTVHKTPRVAIVGLLGESFTRVQEKVKHLPLELIEVRKRDNGEGYSLPSSADYAVCSRWVNHPMYKRLQQEYPDRLVFSSGGESDVVQKVLDIHSRVTGSR